MGISKPGKRVETGGKDDSGVDARRDEHVRAVLVLTAKGVRAGLYVGDTLGVGICALPLGQDGRQGRQVVGVIVGGVAADKDVAARAPVTRLLPLPAVLSPAI
jgi:hypothetical protein